MRFRTDGWRWAVENRDLNDAELKIMHYTSQQIAQIRATPHAEPGDTWRVHWYKDGGDGPLAGYAICCPTCKQVHTWTTASNCHWNEREIPYEVDGVEKSYKVCGHSGVSSCWTWTGSAEENNLTGRASLFAQNSCGWHGFLTNGVLKEV